MSGADELDEAVALANGAERGARRGEGEEAPESSETPRPRSGGSGGGTGSRTGSKRGRESGPDARGGTGAQGSASDGSAHGSGPADGAEPAGRSRRERGSRTGDAASASSSGDDELAAPDWVTARSSRGGDRGSARPEGPDREASSHARDAPWHDARTRAGRAAGPLPSLALPLDEALHHTLGAPLDALTDLPSFDTSAMDGWAVSGPGPWALEGDGTGTGILAGDTLEPRPLPDGRAIPIATGARIPPGASAVLRSEYGEIDGGRLRTTRRPQPGTDIRPRGQECRSGDRLLPAGTRITPAVLGLAAAAGYDRLTVTRRPRAEVLVLGDELLHRGVPRGGRIRDALGPAVAPWLSALGADVIVTRRLGDDAEALHEAVATTTADLLVTTGGTARGPVDHLRPTLARVGARLLVEGVRVRPGHPMLLARLPQLRESGTGSGPHLVGLPGNPLAAISGLVTLAAPLIRALGEQPPEREVFARITEDVQGHPRDTRLVPVAFAPAASRARPLHFNGPAMLRGVATATALAVVPPGGASAGSDVQVLPLPWFTW